MTFTAITAAAAATLAIAYGAGQFMSRQIATEITIDAPASVVWQTLTETDSYAEWNPFIRKLDGTLVQGERLAATIAPEGKSPMDFSPEVLVADENRELRWVGRLVLPGLFDGEHYFGLEEAGGKTTFRHGETFRGMLVYPFLALIGESTETGFNAMNVALKARAEAAAQS